MSARNSADSRLEDSEGRPSWRAVRRAIARLWAGVRELTGDDAYERYLAHHARHHPHEALLDRASFWRADIERRFGGRGVRRCC